MEVHVSVTDDRGAVGAEVESAPVGAAQLPQAIEALLLTLDRPVTSARIAEALGLSRGESDSDSTTAATPKKRKKGGNEPAEAAGQIEAIIGRLNQEYSATGRAFRIEPVAGGFRLMTLPVFAPVIAAFHKSRGAGRLSKAAVETLAIIAYKQPITRAHLEAIRGVACGEVLRSLMERRLVMIKGRAEELGRPILYGTSKEFLDAFGLASLKDLPTATELQIAP